MSTSLVVYKGELRTELEHLKSGNKLITDAPTDNNGKGDAFSPTDLVATALGSCMLTMMGIKCRDLTYSMEGAKCAITKVMASDPRRISEVLLQIVLPAGASEKDRKILEHTARTCPVAKSLHQDIIQDVEFQWQ